MKELKELTKKYLEERLLICKHIKPEKAQMWEFILNLIDSEVEEKNSVSENDKFVSNYLEKNDITADSIRKEDFYKITKALIHNSVDLEKTIDSKALNLIIENDLIIGNFIKRLQFDIDLLKAFSNLNIKEKGALIDEHC